ncbi:unnamed protein product [Sympodiomycopsis kandeliae]
MANTTRKSAKQVHGTNPQFLIEKTIRSRIYDSLYWKEECFALNLKSILDKSLELNAVGGVYSATQKPLPFLCLVLKMLQLQPSEEIVEIYLKNSHKFKYMTALVAMYIRLTSPSIEIYTLLEPLLEDYRKLRLRNNTGSYTLSHMDEFIDDLLTKERVCDIILPRMTKRAVLEDTLELIPRVSSLEDALMGQYGSGSGSGSDASSAEEEEGENKRRWRRKLQKRKLARDKIQNRHEKEVKQQGEGEEEDGYVSQEDSDSQRYVSRSPSRSASPANREGRYISRSPSPEDGQERYISRSPSRSRSPEDRQERYISRSPSRSKSPVNGQGRYISRSPSRSVSPSS